MHTQTDPISDGSRTTKYRYLSYSSLSMVNKTAKSGGTPSKGGIWNLLVHTMQEWTAGIHKNIQGINNSKIFAGLVVVTLNIASKFVNIRLSKTVEAYLKHTFSRDVLIFCIVWMGSREIYIAAAVTLCFILFMDFLLNEDSVYCILPESFTTYHISLLDQGKAAEGYSGMTGSMSIPSGTSSTTSPGSNTTTSPGSNTTTSPGSNTTTSPGSNTTTSPGPVSATVTQPTPNEAVTHDYKPIQWS